LSIGSLGKLATHRAPARLHRAISRPPARRVGPAHPV